MAGGIVGGATITYSWLISLSFFKVQEFQVTGLNYLREDQIMNRLGKIRNQSLFEVKLDDTQKSLESDPWIRSVRLKKHLPDRIEVLVTEKKAVCYLSEGNETYLSDENGIYIGKTVVSVKNIPEIKGIEVQKWIQGNEREGGLVKRGLAFLEMTMKPHFLVAKGDLSSIEMRSEEDLAATIGGTTFLFRYPYAPGQWFRFLSVKSDILARNITIENIDLRYSGKVIVRPQKL